MRERIIGVLLIIFIIFGIAACNDPNKESEFDSLIDENEAYIEIEEPTDDTNYTKISTYMKETCMEAFSPYYELLDFEISNYEEEVADGNIEAVFLYKLVVKNYDKDPDTVEYIKDAKESGNENYQQMYDEYLQPREMNFHLRVIIAEDDSITLYSNISPKGIQWEETKMTDFILD